MAAAIDAIPEAQVDGLVRSLQADLAFVLDDSGVPTWLQARLAFAGVTTASVFARLAGNEDRMREWVANQLKVDPEAAPANAVAISQFLNAWDVSKRRLTRKLEVDAEERAAKLPRTLLKGDHVRLRVALAGAFNRNKALEEKDTPSPASVELLLEQLDDGEVVAESLKQVTNLEEGASDESYTANLRATGAMYFKRGQAEIAAPTTPEQFRRRMRVLQNKWLMVRLKLPSRAQLASLSPDVYNDLVDYILGPEVAGLEAKDASQRVVARPAWADVLNYEFQLRKKAYKAFNETGHAMEAALRHAMEDTQLRERYLTTPMAVSAAAISVSGVASTLPTAASRSAAATAQLQGQWAQEVAHPAQNPRGTQQDTSRVWSRSNFNDRRQWATPDRRAICRRYNAGLCEDAGSCGMLHICDFCIGFGKGEQTHKAKDCPHRPAAQSSDEAAASRKAAGKGGKGGKANKGKGGKGKGGKGGKHGW